jgi:hypothetical protein
MSADRDVTRIVRSWLEEGVTVLPDRVLDSVLDQLPATHQRRSWWPARRFAQMPNFVRFAVAVAAVLVAAVVGLNVLLPARSGIGSPATPTPSPTPIPPLSAANPGVDGLPAGTYLIDRPFPARIALTVPDGWALWTVEDTAAGILVNHDRPPDGSGWGLFFWAGNRFFADPCNESHGFQSPAPSATVDDYVAAVRKLSGVTVSTPSTIDVDGYPATLLVLSAPSDMATCPSGGASIWATPDGTSYVMAPGQPLQLRIVNVKGVPIVIVTTDFPGTSRREISNGASPNPTKHATDQIELRQILASIQIEP